MLKIICLFGHLFFCPQELVDHHSLSSYEHDSNIYQILAVLFKPGLTEAKHFVRPPPLSFSSQTRPERAEGWVIQKHDLLLGVNCDGLVFFLKTSQ